MGLKATDFMGIIPAVVGRKGLKGLSPIALLLGEDDDKKVVPAPKTAKDEQMAGTKGLSTGTETVETTSLKKGGKVAKAKNKGTPKKRKGFNGKGAGAALRGF
jgi:hypothetical protein